MNDVLENDLYRKYPGKAIKALYGNSAVNQIFFKCMSCCGGSRKEVGECAVYSCANWERRPAGKGYPMERPSRAVPTQAELEALLPQYTDEQKAEIAERLASAREVNDAE